MSRYLLLLPAALAVLLPARPVRAWGVTDIFVRRADTLADLVKNGQTPYLNQANCQCDLKLQIELRFDTATPPTVTQHFVVVAGPGTTCLDPIAGSGATGPGTLKSTCPVLYPDTLASSLRVGPLKFDATAKQLEGSACDDQLYTPWNVFVYKQDVGTDTGWMEAKKYSYTVATQPPADPITHGQSDLQAGEASVQVTITIPGGTTAANDSGTTSTLQPNLLGYQVLCERIADDGTFQGYALKEPPSPAFHTAQTEGCKVSTPTTKDGGVADARRTEAGPPDAGPSKDVTPVDGAAVDGAPAVDTGVRDRGRPTEAGPSTTGVGCDTSPPKAECVCSDYKGSSDVITVGGLENGQKYRFFLVAIDTYFNPSAVKPVGDATPAPVEDLWKRYKREGGQSDGGYCFVATAAYGSYDHPQVRILRDFRDRVLLRSKLGRIWVGTYYLAGAGPAAWLQRHPALRPVARALLWPVTIAAAATLYTSTAQKVMLLSMLPIAGLLLIRRRRHAGTDRGGRR